jgi:hypothetical protein
MLSCNTKIRCKLRPSTVVVFIVDLAHNLKIQYANPIPRNATHVEIRVENRNGGIIVETSQYKTPNPNAARSLHC